MDTTLSSTVFPKQPSQEGKGVMKFMSNQTCLPKNFIDLKFCAISIVSAGK